MFRGDGEAEGVWAAAVETLRLRMARETFQRWLQGSRVVEAGEAGLTIGVLSRYGPEWLEHRLKGVVERAVQEAAGRPVAVTFVTRSPEQEQVNDGREDDEEEEPEQEEPCARKRGEAAALEPARRQRNGDDEKLTALDYYIRIKTAFRLHALAELSGSELKVFLCIALHLDSDGAAKPGMETIMKETRLSRSAVCSALARLVCLGLVSKQGGHRQRTRYVVKGYAWFGPRPAPALWEQS